jgi:hypothetical protein
LPHEQKVRLKQEQNVREDPYGLTTLREATSALVRQIGLPEAPVAPVVKPPVALAGIWRYKDHEWETYKAIAGGYAVTRAEWETMRAENEAYFAANPASNTTQAFFQQFASMSTSGPMR